MKKWPNGRIPYALSIKYNDRERAVLARSFSVSENSHDHDYVNSHDCLEMFMTYEYPSYVVMRLNLLVKPERKKEAGIE